LSFLLFNAFDTAPQLEEWILKHCKSNIYFAHRCFWFLRSWCLEVGGLKEPTDNDSSSGAKMSPTASSSLHRRRSSAAPSSTNSLASMLEHQNTQSLDKFPPEERTVMEGLLLRVMECGEIPAKRLLYGTPEQQQTQAQSLNGYASLESMDPPLEAAESGLLPVDPHSGTPSVGHLDTVTASRTFGFLPLLDDNNHSVTTTTTMTSVLLEEGGVFLKTPRFLDALMQLADDLFLIPREMRTNHLRQQLARMETEWLPSNAIYLPVQNLFHRVWRIVKEESIALSTKERVPCIVCLEVVDFLEEEQEEDRHPLLLPSLSPKQLGTDREILRQWRMEPRPPRRHETFLNKVTTFTNESIRLSIQKIRTAGPERLVWLPSRNRGGSESMDLDIDNDHDDEEENHDGGEEQSGGGVSLQARAQKQTLLKKEDHDEEKQHQGMGQWTSPNSTPIKDRRIGGLKQATDDVEIPIMLGTEGDGLWTPSRTSKRMIAPRHRVVETAAYGSTKQENQDPPHTPRTPPVVFKESWEAKENRLRSKSAFGSNPNWHLMPILIKSNDDLRQEQLASQLIYRMATILAKEKVPVWLCPYEILALTDRGGIIEAIPDTISIDSLKRNDANFTSLAQFFTDYFGTGTEALMDAKANFVESLAGYSMVCFLLQLKDRHNGNILLDNRGHLIHIDFGFFFLSSPGKNSGFESAPFKLTRDFCELMDGPNSHAFRTFRELCARTFLCLRKHCYEITLLVEMLMVGNEDLNCFRGRPQDAVRQLRQRFRLDLNDRACTEYVNSLIDESLENWRTRWYDRYQRFCVGVL